MAEKQKTFSLLPKVLNGGIAGFIAVCCVFPLDLVKTRMQNQVIGPNGERMYASIKDALIKTFRQEGFFGMYQGSLINIVLIMPEKALKLASNDYLRFHLKKADGSLPMYRQIMAGAGSAISQMIVTIPMEFVKIQMQDQGRVSTASGQAPAAKSTVQVIASIVRKHGILGLYKGSAATLLRDVPFSMIYFPLFANVNAMCPVDKRGEGVLWCTFMSGFVAGSTAAITVTPCDVVKTRLQTMRKTSGEDHYTGIPDAFAKILRKEGWRALFKGGACRIMVIAPLFGISQVVYFFGIAEYLLGLKKNA